MRRTQSKRKGLARKGAAKKTGSKKRVRFARGRKFIRGAKRHAWEIAAGGATVAALGVGLYTGGDLAVLLGTEGAAFANSIPGVAEAAGWGAAGQNAVSWVGGYDNWAGRAAKRVKKSVVRGGGHWVGGTAEAAEHGFVDVGQALVRTVGHVRDHLREAKERRAEIEGVDKHSRVGVEEPTDVEWNDSRYQSFHDVSRSVSRRSSRSSSRNSMSSDFDLIDPSSIGANSSVHSLSGVDIEFWNQQPWEAPSRRPANRRRRRNGKIRYGKRDRSQYTKKYS
jgi:hypothetical protein